MKYLENSLQGAQIFGLRSFFIISMSKPLKKIKISLSSKIAGNITFLDLICCTIVDVKNLREK